MVKNTTYQDCNRVVWQVVVHTYGKWQADISFGCKEIFIRNIGFVVDGWVAD